MGSSNSGGARLVHAIKEWAAPTQEMEAQSHLAHFCDQSDHCKNQRPGLNWLRRIVQGAPKGFLCALSRCMHHTDCLNKPACWSRQSLLVTRKTSRGTQHSTRMLYVALPSLRHTHAHAHTHTLHSTGTHTLQLWHATAQKYKLHSPLRHTHTHRHPLCGNGTQDCKQRLQAHGMKGP